MKIKTTVLCLPVTELEKTLGFYKGVFGFSDAKIEEGIIALEFPNLSIFLMEKASYESYSAKAGRAALLPGDSAPVIISCAVETKQDVDSALERALEFGGKAPGAAAIDASFGGYIGYVSDPEGHLWEIVCPKPN
jgi:predicted lactoylglutathione lyase